MTSPHSPPARRATGCRRHLAACLLAGATCGTAPALAAQEQQEEGEGKDRGWSLGAELSVVLATGNAESSTLGAGTSLRHVGDEARWSAAAGGLRTKSADITRRAVGTPEDFEVVEESESELTAENYYARTRFDRSLSERTFLYGGASWVRNTFTGIDARWTVVGGGGVTVTETERSHLRVDLGGTYTVEDPTVEPAETARFAGIRFSSDYRRRLAERTELTSLLVVDENLDDSDDLRADLTNAIAVSINRALALRAGLQLLFDAQPALEQVPLFTAGGEPTGETVLAELDELDTLLTVAIVIEI